MLEGLVSSKASLLGLEVAIFLPRLHVVFLCASVSNLCCVYKDRGRSMCMGRKRVHSLRLIGKSKSRDNMMLISVIPSRQERGLGAGWDKGTSFTCVCLHVRLIGLFSVLHSLPCPGFAASPMVGQWINCMVCELYLNEAIKTCLWLSH